MPRKILKKPEPDEEPENISGGNGIEFEEFLQAFEKPTQIYRFLKLHRAKNPSLFLQRNLSYTVKGKKPPERRKRKLNELLQVAEKKVNSEALLPGELTLTFSDVVLPTIASSKAQVAVDLTINNCQRKRKETVGDTQTVHIGECAISVASTAPKKFLPGSKLTLDPDKCPTNGHKVKDMSLNFHLSVASDECKPSPAKRGRRSLSPAVAKTSESQQLSAQLPLAVANEKLALLDGEYELLMSAGDKPEVKRRSGRSSRGGHLHDKSDGMLNGTDEHSSPVLRFAVEWKVSVQKNHKPARRPSTISSGFAGTITYQISWKGRPRLQLKPERTLRCPWCMLHGDSLYSLLKHLRLCHSRFNFYYTPVLAGARIDVSINEAFDGSYTGRAQDLLSSSQACYGRVGPTRRASFTELLVNRRMRRQLVGVGELSEFMDDSKDNRAQIVGHNRQYYHSRLLQPVLANEDYDDSEAELDPEWLRTKTCNMLDEFTDVNEGEKELMKMWNLHIMKNGYLGDCALSCACRDFLDEYGEEIVGRALSRNLVLHLCNLHDFRLIPSSLVRQLIAQLNSIRVT